MLQQLNQYKSLYVLHWTKFTVIGIDGIIPIPLLTRCLKQPDNTGEILTV